MTTYRLNLIDSDERPAILDHTHVTRVSAPYLQDSGRYRVDIDTDEPIEDALDADEAVLSYERVEAR